MATQVQTDQLATAVAGIRDHLRQVGDGARADFTSDTRLIEGFQTEAQIRQFTLTVDEPANLGGADQGPNPVELVLAALGTCQEIVYATYARVLGIPVDSVSVKADGWLDPRGFFGVADVPAGFQEVSFAVDVVSPAPPAEISRLIATVNARCPVLDILQRPLPVAGQYRHNGQTVAAADTAAV